MPTLDIEEITEIQKHLLLCKSLSFRRKLALDLGLYKVVVAGTSNSGKSTLVNALSGRELLPESMSTSTKITTYIGRSCLGASYDVIVMGGQDRTRQHMEYDAFLREYVYGLKEIYQGEQSAENLMSGFVNCSHDLTDHGVCLIDTIGIGINDYDVKRTAEIMREADVVVFLYDGSKHGNLTSDEIDFLKATLFKDKKRPLLPYERMIFAPNKMDCVASTAQIKQILSYDLGNFVPSGSGEWQQLVKNIFPISARYHRLAQVGIANYSAVKDSMTRAELMNNDFEIIQNASFRSGDYKNYLKERSGVNLLVDRIVDILGDIDIDDIIDKYI
ncbi:dynamin family protein [Butyricimonas synergistica]|uniref:dynamin family protein n=1 Tax=Butyricimonas synergistica TaxID=544644 RepID=UPI00036078AC|nr:dynamin family protein [Butyricimonas synergistica]